MAEWAGTVMVEPGTYKEMVVIHQTVTLESDSSKANAAATTIIDATGLDHGILIQGPGAAGTTIAGLTVENATQEGIMAVSTSNLTIEHNNVTGNATSTPANPTDETNPDFEAVHLMGTTNSLVWDNNVHDNKDGGIYLTNETGPATGNQVLDNTVTNNAVDCGITLASHVATNTGVSNNLIEGNTSNNNGAAGILLATPVPGGQAHDNYIINNTVMNNGFPGVVIIGHEAGDNMNGNEIINNTISGNAGDPDTGLTKTMGIVVFGAMSPVANVMIVGNSISNEDIGILVGNVTSATIFGNTNTATTPMMGQATSAPPGNTLFTCNSPGGLPCAV
jgi:parallel beta-helix repeat protein